MVSLGVKFLAVIVIEEPALPELGLNERVAGADGTVVAVGGAVVGGTDVLVGGAVVGMTLVGGTEVGGTVVLVGSGGGWVGTTPAPALGVEVGTVEPEPDPEPDPPVEPPLLELPLPPELPPPLEEVDPVLPVASGLPVPAGA